MMIGFHTQMLRELGVKETIFYEILSKHIYFSDRYDCFDLDGYRWTKIDLNSLYDSLDFFTKEEVDSIILKLTKKNALRRIDNAFTLSRFSLYNICDCEQKEPVKKKTNGYVYVIKDSAGYYKIGRAKNFKNRKKKYLTENSQEIEVVFCKKVEDCIKEEKCLHEVFKDKNHNREWFKLNNEDICEIKKYLKSK